MEERNIPLFKPSISDEEINEVTATLRSGWLTTGPKTKEFEENFSKYTGAKHSIGVINCTTALFMSLIASKIKPGSEVITTPLTFCATANVIEQLNLKTVFADVDRKTGCISPKEIRKEVTGMTKAIIPVHFAGQPCDMDPIGEIAEKNNLEVIEDAAHAIGASYKNRKIGTISRFSCFSFYANKNITTGQGGMITVNDDEDAKFLRMLRMYGFQEGAESRYTEEQVRHYYVEFPGYNFRMFDLLAAVGIPQLKKLDDGNHKRAMIKKTYDDHFSKIGEIELLHANKNITSHGLHIYSIIIDASKLRISRDEFANRLKARKIGVGIHYDALHLHTYYKNKYGFKPGDFPNAEHISSRTISLPFFPSMTDDDTDYVISSVKEIINESRK